jgi:predicted nucleic acid-binding protein
MRTSSSSSSPSPQSWSPQQTVTISRDPDDDRLIEAALEADTDVIVNGDQDLLTLGRIGHIQILTPREFLECLPSGT